MNRPAGVTEEEWLDAQEQVCIGGEDAGTAFFKRHSHLGLACATAIQCELNKAKSENAALKKQVEERGEAILALGESAAVRMYAELDLLEENERARVLLREVLYRDNLHSEYPGEPPLRRQIEDFLK